MRLAKIEILLFAMLPSLAAQAGNWQFSAIGGDVAVTNGEAVVSWSGFGGSALAPLHGSGNSWGSPAATNGAVRFSAGATPLALPESATSLVSCVFVVATATNLAERSTLLFASTSVWLAPTPSGGFTLAPAMAGSTHDPVNASDHEPELSQPETSQYSPLCPEATNVTLKAGWTHDTAILHIRNLVRIQTHNPWDDETDHSIGLVWSAGGATNLFYYLDDCCKPFADSFSYYVNGSPCDGMLEFGPKPDEFHPRVFHVELCLADGGTVLDRMWIVVNARESKEKFDTWYSENSTNFGWTASLPRPCSQLTFTDGEPHEGFGGTGNWSSPSPLGKSYMHHDAVYETRTYLLYIS